MIRGGAEERMGEESPGGVHVAILITLLCGEENSVRTCIDLHTQSRVYRFKGQLIHVMVHTRGENEAKKIHDHAIP